MSLKAEVAKLENEKAAFVYKNNLHHRSDTMDLAECMFKTVRSLSTIFFTRTLTEIHTKIPQSGDYLKPAVTVMLILIFNKKTT